MPIGLLRDTSSGLISPQLVKEPTSANKQLTEDLTAGKDTATGLKAATAEGDAAARFLPDFPPTIPLAQARTSQSSICSEACAPSWGTASQLCADDLFGSGSLSTTTSAGGSSSGGAGYSAGGSSLHGLAPFHGGDLSHSHCGSGYSEDRSTGAFFKRRVPPYASSSAATPKHTRYLRNSSLGAVAEQLDRSMPPCVEDEEAPWLLSQGTETAPAAQGPPLLPTNPAATRSSPSDHVASLRVDGQQAHEREGDVCSQNTATAQFPSTSTPLELSQSDATGEEPAGRVGAMVALFDNAVRKSRAVSFDVCANTSPSGPSGLEHDKQSPLMGGCVRCSPHRQPAATSSIGLRNSRSTPSAWGPVHTQQWYGSTLNDVAGAATAATTSSRSSQALNDLLAQPMKRQQRQTDSSSRQAACTGAAAAPSITSKYIPPHVSPQISTSARPHTRLAATHRNASQQAKRSSGPALSPLAARPPFNPYGKAPAKTTATAASMPNGPHNSSSTPLAALHTTASASGAASAGRRPGPQLPRLIVQHSAPASINSTVATHASDQARRPPNPAPINTTTSSRPHITQAAGPVTVTAGPQRSRTTSSGSGRNSSNSKAARPPSNPPISTFSALSPSGKKILNTAITTAARAADAAAIVAPASGLAHGYAWDQLRHPVCRYSVDSVCSDRFPTDRQVSSPPPSEPQPEMTVSPLPRSQQRLFTVRPSTSPTPTGLCSPAETLPLLRNPYVPSLVQALDNSGQRLPPPTLLYGLEDIVPMASPVSAAIYGAGNNACEAGPRAAAGARERRRRIDDHWSWAVPDSVQSAYTPQGDVLTVKPRAGRNTRLASSESSSGTDASDMDDFGLPAWAWRSVAVLLSQSVDASMSHREREQSPLLRPPGQAAGATQEQPSETGRPAHLLPSYSPNDPLMVPLRRLTGTPLRKRSDDPSTAVQASILHLTRPATAATSSRPRYCQELTYLEADIDSFSVEEVTTVLLSRQQARCRYSLESLNGRSSLSIHAGEAAAVAAPSHASSDSDEPSNPLPIPSDEVAGWMEHASGPLPSSGARLLPFSGAHIDAMVLESLRQSCAGLAEPAQRRPTFAKKVGAAAEADMKHALQDDQRAGKSVTDDAETFLEVEAEISPQLLYPTSSSESVDDSDEQEHPDVSPRGLAATAISSGLLHQLDLRVIISDGRRERQALELSSALTVLWAVPAFLSGSRPGPGSDGSCAAHADWGAAWAAAICVAGTLAALTVEMAPAFICCYATAAMAAAGLMVAVQTGARCFRRHRSRSQQALATTAMQHIPLSGLGAGLTPRCPVLFPGDRLQVSPLSIRVAASEDQPYLNQTQDGITCYSASNSCTKDSGGASEDGALRTATATAQRNDTLPGSCPPSQAKNLVTPDATAGRRGDTDVDTDGGMLAIASGAISTFTQAISAMRASGCERAALRWMARACGVYAGMQMAAAAHSDGSVLPDATSADWEAMRGLVRQCLSKPQQLTTAPDFAEAVEVPLKANFADGIVTYAVSCCLVPAAHQPLSSGGGLLVDGEHQRCEAQATLMGAHLRAATLSATFLSTEPTRSSLVLQPSMAGELPGPPMNLGLTSSEVASADVAADVCSHRDHLTMVSRSSGGTHSPSSFLEQHEQEPATPEAEITALPLDATTKQINEERALTTLAEAHCLFTPLAGAIPNPTFAAGANRCMLSTEDSLALEALAPQCCTRQFAYDIAEAMCSPISTWEALAGSAGLAIRQEEVLAAYSTMVAEEARLSVFAAGAQDVACLELWEARGAREGAAFTVEEAALCAANKEEDAMGVLVKKKEQQLQQVARAAAAHDAVEMYGEPGCASALDSLWDQQQQQQQLVQRCIALEKEASAATTVQAENGGEVAVKAHIAGRWELLALVLYADGANVADCIHGSAALEAAVQDLFRQRALQLQAVADVAAVDSATTITALDLEEAACRTCAEVQHSWLLGAAAAEAAADSRNALLGVMAEEAALVRLARSREVLAGICFAVEAMEAATALRAYDTEEASLKALAKRRARCMASHGGIVATAAKTAVAAAAAEDIALEQLAVARAQHLVALSTVVADDIRAMVSAANAEHAGLEQLQQECAELVARQGASDAAIAAIAVQAAAGEELAVQALAAELYVVDTAVGAEMSATAGQALIACGLVYMQLRKQQLFMHATFLGCMTLAALVAASSVASLYCNGAPARSRQSRRGNVKARGRSKPLPSEVLAGFWPGAVSPLRGFPLRSLGEECSDGDASHGGGEVAANEVCGVAPASFPVFLGDEASETLGSSNGGEEEQEQKRTSVRKRVRPF